MRCEWKKKNVADLLLEMELSTNHSRLAIVMYLTSAGAKTSQSWRFFFLNFTFNGKCASENYHFDRKYVAHLINNTLFSDGSKYQARSIHNIKTIYQFVGAASHYFECADIFDLDDLLIVVGWLIINKFVKTAQNYDLHTVLRSLCGITTKLLRSLPPSLVSAVCGQEPSHLLSCKNVVL